MNKLLKYLIKFVSNKNLNIEWDAIKLMFGQQAIISSRALYSTLIKLHDAEVKVFSQWGEDGILDFLFTKLEISKPKMVEFGVGVFDECNSRFTAEFRNASVYMVDLNDDLTSNVFKMEINWKNQLFPVIDLITPDNALNHLKTAKTLMGGVDVVSLDIDGNDYWVLKALELEEVSIVICEYNPVYGGEIMCTIVRDDKFNRAQAHHSLLHYGMSLKAAISLMDNKGFTFVGSNRVGNNAFFLKKDFIYLMNFTLPNINNLDDFVDWRVRESRDLDGNLNYLGLKDARKAIANCLVFNIESASTIKVSQI